jgi:hypothetical protein
MSSYAIGDRVQLNSLGISRELYSPAKSKRVGTIVAFGKGPRTQYCAKVLWASGGQNWDMLSMLFLMKEHSHDDQSV